MRVVKEDFEELKKYIENFNIKTLLKDEDYINFISTCHKKYYSFFVTTIEYESCYNDAQYNFLKEANSDLATSLFHIMTGSYKSGRLLLRSSIECYLKSLTMDWLPDIEKEKSVYEIFNKIKELDYFKSEPQKSQFINIHRIYKELCKDVHAADKVNMAQIDALDLLPSYSKKKANKICDIYLDLIPAYIFLISDKFNAKYHKIHHINKEIILMGINKELRPFIMRTKE